MSQESKKPDWKSLEQEKLEQFELDKTWWRVALRELLKWSEQKINLWIEEKDEYYSTPMSLGPVLNELPAYEILPELTPEPLRENLQHGETGLLLKFYTRLQYAIENNQYIDWYNTPVIDWEACRKRVNEVLAEYGYRLPRDDDCTDNS